MNTQSQWYAVYTKPRWEKKVAGLFEKRGIEHYCPLNKVVRQWSDRKKTVLEPLFKSYVFINITAEELTKVRMTDGVVNLVYWLGKPAVIRNEEIDTIKRFLNDHENVVLEKTEVSVNDRVCIMTGPFLDQQGRVIEITNKLVKVQLPSLGFAMVAQVARESVKVIPIETRVGSRESGVMSR
jgi:transcription antitermination factor NusG